MKGKIGVWLPIVLGITMLLGLLPPKSLALNGTGIDVNGCNINPDKPLMRDGSIEAPATARCGTELVGREIIVELWQRNNDDVWKEVPETDLTVDAELAIPTSDLGLSNISCRRLERDRTRRFKTRIVASDGSGNFTGGFSPVEELRRDCLDGMDDADVDVEDTQSGGSNRRRKPPKGAVVASMTIDCNLLKDDPKMSKKAGCTKKKKKSSDVGAEQNIVKGLCGEAFIFVKDKGGGLAYISYGWWSHFLVAEGESTITWTNYTRGTGSFFIETWLGPTKGELQGKYIRTGTGNVGALQSGLVWLLNAPPGSFCTIKDPFDSARIT